MALNDTEERYIKRRQQLFILGWIFGILVFIGISAALLLLAIQGADTNRIANTLDNVAEESKENTDRIVDCTTPGGQCYENSTERIVSINEISILAAFCANQPENNTETLIRKCITERLENE